MSGSRTIMRVLLLVGMIFISCGCFAHRTTVASSDGSIVNIRSGCGSLFGTPPFSGRVVRITPENVTLPITDVVFFRGVGEGSVADGSLREVPAVVDPAGHFSLPVSIATSDTEWRESGKVVKSEEWVEDVVFVLRAPGCDAQVIHFTHEWKERDILMVCPDRPTEQVKTGS